MKEFGPFYRNCSATAPDRPHWLKNCLLPSSASHYGLVNGSTRPIPSSSMRLLVATMPRDLLKPSPSQQVWNRLMVYAAGLYMRCLFCTDNSWPLLSSTVNDMLYFLFGVDMLPWVLCGLIIYWLPFHQRWPAFNLRQTYYYYYYYYCEMRVAFTTGMLPNLASPVFFNPVWLSTTFI